MIWECVALMVRPDLPVGEYAFWWSSGIQITSLSSSSSSRQTTSSWLSDCNASCWSVSVNLRGDMTRCWRGDIDSLFSVFRGGDMTHVFCVGTTFCLLTSGCRLTEYSSKEELLPDILPSVRELKIHTCFKDSKNNYFFLLLWNWHNVKFK